MGLGEPGHQRQQAIGSVSSTYADAQQPTRHRLCTGDRALGLGDLLERYLTLLPIKLPFICDLDAARCPRKQAHTKTLFEPTDRSTDCRRGYAKNLGRARETSQLCGFTKLLDVAELNRVNGGDGLFQNVINQLIYYPIY